jgi:hypothetical protein
MSILPPTITLYGWARARRLHHPPSYFRELAQHWQPMAKHALRREAGKRHAPKNYLGLHWQTTGRRERAAYQILKKA